ncbi:MAG: TIGR03564 family F420-dependent LLM class oxidoreductase [Chloroflexi bacterium]|nr:TIGR03564 family F420-dependent LLM class oxidoreductase [Chloroflexota bacterium]
MRIGLGIGLSSQSPASVSEFVGQIESVERDGFEIAWLPQILGFDSLTMIAMAGPRTSKIEFVTGVVPVYPRHPVALAQQALTVASATGNRLALGIGVAHPETVTTWWGIPYDRPAKYMREYLSVLMPLLHGRRVRFKGEFFTSEVALRIGEIRPPGVLLAALAPRMLDLAGSVAGGTVLWLVGRKAVETHVMPKITAAAKAAGKPAPRICVGLPICVTDDAPQARAAADKQFARYGQLVNYRRALDIEGAEGPGDVSVVGNEAEVERQLRAFASAGATDFLASIFVPDGSPPESTRRTRTLLQNLVGKV